MPLRFSSLRRGLLLVAVNHKKGEPHGHSGSSRLHIIEELLASMHDAKFINASLAIDFVASSIFLLNKFRNNHPSLEDCHAVAVGVP